MAEGNSPQDIDQIRFNDVFSALPTTIFETMSILAAKHQSINLGQGFPDNELEGPASMKETVYTSMTAPGAYNQYAPMMGVPALRQAIAEHSSRFLNTIDNSIDNILVTLGATEALASSFLGLLNPGDEVIVFTPLYDSYLPLIRRVGAVPVLIQLQPPRWEYDVESLKAAFTPRTKLIVVNTPHNPTGKVFSKEELMVIAECVNQSSTPVICLLDEVYEHHVYPGKTHTSLAGISEVRDQCIRIGSAGKTFSFTDFKVGWIVSSNVRLVQAVAKAHQFLTFTVNSKLQNAVAHGLNHEQSFFMGLGELLYKKRQYMEERLTKVGFTVLPAEGTYFLIADFAPLLPVLVGSNSISEYDDVAFCTEMTINAGVTLIPVSAFYDKRSEAPKTMVRFVICKTDEKLKAACDALEKYFQSKVVI